MCQVNYYPLLVISVEGDSEFIKVPIDIMQLYRTEGGSGNILQFIYDLEGLELDHVYTDIESEISFFLGMECIWCDSPQEGGGHFIMDIPDSEGRSLFLSDFDRKYGFWPTSYLKATFSLLIMDVLEEYFSILDSNSTEEFFYEGKNEDEELHNDRLTMENEPAISDTDYTGFYTECPVDLESLCLN